jgi:hypothetical protein
MNQTNPLVIEDVILSLGDPHTYTKKSSSGGMMLFSSSTHLLEVLYSNYGLTFNLYEPETYELIGSKIFTTDLTTSKIQTELANLEIPPETETLEEITNIAIELSAPITGLVTTGASSSSILYKLISTTWQKNDGYIIGLGQVFEPNTTYIANIAFRAKSGYEFAEEVNIQLPETASLMLANAVDDLYVVTIQFPETN